MSILSPLIAATATIALNAGLWCRRGRLAMVFSSLAASCRCCADNPLIPVVQISGTTSITHHALCSNAPAGLRRGQKRHRNTLEQRSNRRPDQQTENPETQYVRPSRSRIAVGYNASVPPHTLRQSRFKGNVTPLSIPGGRRTTFLPATMDHRRHHAEKFEHYGGTNQRRHAAEVERRGDLDHVGPYDVHTF